MANLIPSILQFELPPLPNSLPFACHPDFVSISRDVDAWLAEKMKILPGKDMSKFVQVRIGMFASLMHPHGERGKVVLAGKHLWTMFLLDDVLETRSTSDLKELVWELAACTGSKVMEKHEEFEPVISMFQEVVSELRSSMSSFLYKRYLSCLSTYLDAVYKESHQAKTESIPTPAEYHQLRFETGFMEVMANIMTEFCQGIEIDENITELEDFKSMIRHISQHIVLVNDLLSFRKEYFQNNVNHNWLTVLFHHTPDVTTFQEVVYKVVEMIQEEEDVILSLQNNLINTSSRTGIERGKLETVIHAYLLSVSGHLRWSYITSRYHGHNNTLLTGHIFSGTWIFVPRATIVLPALNNYVSHPYLISE